MHWCRSVYSIYYPYWKRHLMILACDLLLHVFLFVYRVIRNDCRGFNNCHLVLQMQPHVISFYGVTSRIRFMFLLFPQVSRNWWYESEPPLKPSPLTCYRLWSERENQQDATVRCLFLTISQYVSDIIMPIFRRTRRVLLHVLCCAVTSGES